MARKFLAVNSQSLRTTRTLNLSRFLLIAISFWMYWDAYAADDKLALELTDNFNTTTGGFLLDPNSSQTAPTNVFDIGIGNGAGTYASGYIARPSAAVWHHYYMGMDRAGQICIPYVDGVSVSWTQRAASNMAVNTRFADAKLNVMSRAATSLFGSGRMADLAMWGGVGLTPKEIERLATGALLPDAIRPDRLVFYNRMSGGTPERSIVGPDFAVAATFDAHPQWLNDSPIPYVPTFGSKL